MYIRFGLIVTLALLTVGCMKPKIDASTDELFQTSSQKVRESLPNSKRAEFDEALQVLISQVEIQSDSSRNVAGPSSVESKMHTDLNGKTANEVFSHAIKIRDLKEVMELEKRKQAQLVAGDVLKKIEILSYELKEFNPSYDFSRTNPDSIDELKKFGVMNYEFLVYYAGDSVAVFDVTFKNGTEFPIYNVYLDVTISTSDQPVPYFSDTLFYPIANGLEPGDTNRITWAVSNSAWFDNPLNAMSEESVQFTVESSAVRGGEDGDTWYAKSDFGDVEEDRLLKLKRKYSL